jgi:hypothetical protein
MSKGKMPMMKPKALKGKFKQVDKKGGKPMKGAKMREKRLEKEPM